MNKKLSVVFKIIIIVIGIISLILTTGVLDGNFNAYIFMMFTTLSNLFCVLYFIISLIKKKYYPFVYGEVLICIMVTFLVAQFVLKMSFSFESYSGSAFLGLHYIVPIMTFLNYLLFEKKGLFKKYYPLLWLIIPFIYFIVCLITKTYTYPFIDINRLGIKGVALNVLFLTIGFTILGYLIYLLDRLLIHKNHK